MLPRTYSLSEAYDAAEVVALVTVGDWLEEELITGRTFSGQRSKKCTRGYPPMSLSWPRRLLHLDLPKLSRIHLWQSAAAVPVCGNKNKVNQADTLGEKGIGRLSTQRLGKTVIVETVSEKTLSVFV